MGLTGWIAESMKRRSMEAESRIRSMVTENLQAQMASYRTSRRLALSTPSTPPASTTTVTEARPMTADAILQQMRELVLSTEPWEEMPVIPISATELGQLQEGIPMVPDLTARKGLATLTAMGCSLQLVKPGSPMTVAELRQWLLARRKLKTLTE